MKLLLLYILVIIIIVLQSYIIIITKKTIKENNVRLLSLSDFNKIFDTDIIELPCRTAAIGINNNEIYVHYIHDAIANKMFNTIYYWMDNIHKSLGKDKYYFILCYNDGFRKNKPVDKLITYITTTDGGDIHKNKYIFAYSKYIYDDNTITLPNFYYTSRNGHHNLLKSIDDNYIDWNDKINKCTWRGDIKNGSIYNFYNYEKYNVNQRKYFTKLFKNGIIKNMEYSKKKLSQIEQIKYKYILDIDGHSSTWDATVWKLYSGSVLLKVKSIWKEWYYDMMKEWVHYIPIKNDLSDLNIMIEWCINNDDICRTISNNARLFIINTNNWLYVKNEIIKSVKDKV